MLYLYILLSLWFFWLLYVLVMGIYRAHLAKRLTLVTYMLSAPAVLVGFVVDLMMNWTVAIVVFLDPPIKVIRRNCLGFWLYDIELELLVTTRLIRYKDLEPCSWRGQLADYICGHMLDMFDPSEDHCERKGRKSVTQPT